MKPGDIVAVNWLDPIHSGQDLTHKEAAKLRPFSVTTYGKIISVSEEQLVISSEHFTDDGIERSRETIVTLVRLVRNISHLRRYKDETLAIPKA